MRDKSLPIFGNLSIQSADVGQHLNRELSDLIARRSTPGIMIFTYRNELVYMNAEARDAIGRITGRGKGTDRQRNTPFQIPEIVLNLCTQLKQFVSRSSQNSAAQPGENPTPSVQALASGGTKAYAFRALYLSNNQNGNMEGTYILILIEQVSPAKKMNLHKVAQQFGLSQREIQVIELLIQGRKNKEIAERLCVCVYTVEGHLKKVMKKLQVSNRTSILAKLLEGN